MCNRIDKKCREILGEDFGANSAAAAFVAGKC